MINKKNNSLSKDQIDKLKSLIDEQYMIFSNNDKDIGTVNDKFGHHHKILNTERPIKQRQYKIPQAKELNVDE